MIDKPKAPRAVTVKTAQTKRKVFTLEQLRRVMRVPPDATITAGTTELMSTATVVAEWTVEREPGE